VPRCHDSGILNSVINPPMKLRYKLELLFVITVLLVKFWNFQLLYCAYCTPSAIILGGLTILLVMALVRRTAWLAFVLGFDGALSALRLGNIFFSAPHAHSLTSNLLFARDEAVYVACAFCLFDLWLEWQKPEAFYGQLAVAK